MTDQPPMDPGPLDHLLALTAAELAERAVSLRLPPDAFTPRIVAGLIGRIDTSGGPDAFWPYLGSRNGANYGVVSLGGSTRSAHRLVYVLAVGPLPDPRLLIRHDCDDPPCCNPSHLRAGTATQNMADAIQRGRARNHVLTPDEAEFVPRLIDRILQAHRRRKRPMTRAQAFAFAAETFDITATHAGSLYDRARADARAPAGTIPSADD